MVLWWHLYKVLLFKFGVWILTLDYPLYAFCQTTISLIMASAILAGFTSQLMHCLVTRDPKTKKQKEEEEES